MKDVQYSQAVANANWGAINGLVSGSCQIISLDAVGWFKPSGSSYDVPKNHWGRSHSSDIEVYVCEYCGHSHRVDTSKLDAVTILDCLKCGASLV